MDAQFADPPGAADNAQRPDLPDPFDTTDEESFDDMYARVTAAVLADRDLCLRTVAGGRGRAQVVEGSLHALDRAVARGVHDVELYFDVVRADAKKRFQHAMESEEAKSAKVAEVVRVRVEAALAILGARPRAPAVAEEVVEFLAEFVGGHFADSARRTLWFTRLDPVVVAALVRRAPPSVELFRVLADRYFPGSGLAAIAAEAGSLAALDAALAALVEFGELAGADAPPGASALVEAWLARPAGRADPARSKDDEKI